MGQYIDSSRVNECGKCDPGCVGCEGTAKNCTSSDGCNAGTYYHAVTSECLALCPSNYYAFADATSAKCVKCEEGCAECTGAGLTKCSKCQAHNNGTKYYKKFNINECTASCPGGFYEYDLTLTCEKCDPSC